MVGEAFHETPQSLYRVMVSPCPGSLITYKSLSTYHPHETISIALLGGQRNRWEDRGFRDVNRVPYGGPRFQKPPTSPAWDIAQAAQLDEVDAIDAPIRLEGRSKLGSPPNVPHAFVCHASKPAIHRDMLLPVLSKTRDRPIISRSLSRIRTPVCGCRCRETSYGM